MDGKKADTPLTDLSEKVTHPILLIIEEPEKRVSGSANNPYRKFAKHIPNLESHLNRIALKFALWCGQGWAFCHEEVAKLIDRINNGKFATINLQNHQIRHVNPVIQLLQNIPRIGAQRARKIHDYFDNFQHLLADPDEKLKQFLTKQDYETVRKFLTDNWITQE